MNDTKLQDPATSTESAGGDLQALRLPRDFFCSLTSVSGILRTSWSRYFDFASIVIKYHKEMLLTISDFPEK